MFNFGKKKSLSYKERQVATNNSRAIITCFNTIRGIPKSIKFTVEGISHLGDKSPDIFKGKDDINIKEIDWNDELISINYVDEFPSDLSHYIKENNLNIETIEKIIEIFKQKTKNFDERIWDRLDIILNEWDERILED